MRTKQKSGESVLYRVSQNFICKSFCAPGKPDPVKDCSVTNKTFTSIHVDCKPGYDGGLLQTFVIEVFPVSAIEAAANAK